MNAPARPLRLLHLHSSFAPGGKELRTARLMNLFGRGIEHSVVSAVPGELGASRALDPATEVAFPVDFPPLAGSPGPARLLRLARAMRGHDLVLTYNWGAMDAVMAHRLFGRMLSLPPLVHHEDGFNQDEAERLKLSRNLFRRLALGGAAALVVPSERLEKIALGAWGQPARRVRRIANGIALERYAAVGSGTLPGLNKAKDELWLGTLAGLRTVKNLPRLVRAFAAMPPEWQLVIAGDGPERAAIEGEARRLGLAKRVHLPGHVDPPALLGLCDLFALSSDSEQFPISVIEAMAAGLAVVSPRVGDIAAMVAPANRAWLSPPGDEEALATLLGVAAASPSARTTIGRANRERALAEYDEAAMLDAYRAVYAQVLGRAQFP